MNILVAGLSNHPGHVSHMIAFYKLCEACGFSSYIYTYKDSVRYFPQELRCLVYGEKIGIKVDVVLFYTPSKDNLSEILKFKYKFSSKILYVFHEPLTKLSVYKNAGFSISQLFKLELGAIYDAVIVKLVNTVLLASKTAVDYYDNNKLYWNKNRYYFPLIYDDEYKIGKERKYISYIGTIASDHSYNEYVDFIKKCWKYNLLSNCNFLIATKSYVVRDEDINQMEKDGILRIIDGHPMTNDEINEYYAESFIIWNAYQRTTQSSVLPKAFMFGCPAIIMKKNISYITEDKKNVFAVDDNKDADKLLEASKYILNNYSEFTNNARSTFETKCHWNNYIEDFKKILEPLIQ